MAIFQIIYIVYNLNNIKIIWLPVLGLEIPSPMSLSLVNLSKERSKYTSGMATLWSTYLPCSILGTRLSNLHLFVDIWRQFWPRMQSKSQWLDRASRKLQLEVVSGAWQECHRNVKVLLLLRAQCTLLMINCIGFSVSKPSYDVLS